MRIKVPIPTSTAHFKTEIPIQIGDLNYGNHLGNDRLLLLAHESRIRFFTSIEQTELCFFNSGLIMTDSAVQYLRQGAWGENLKFKLWLQPINEMRFDLFYKISVDQRNDQENSRDLAYIKTGMAFFDYSNQKVVKSSPDYIEFVEGLDVL